MRRHSDSAALERYSRAWRESQRHATETYDPAEVSKHLRRDRVRAALVDLVSALIVAAAAVGFVAAFVWASRGSR